LICAKKVLFNEKSRIERVQAFGDISCSRYVVIATKPVHRLQISPIVHNYRAPPTIPPSYIWVRAVVWECIKGQIDTHTQMAMTTIRFVSTTRVKCKNVHLKTAEIT